MSLRNKEAETVTVLAGLLLIALLAGPACAGIIQPDSYAGFNRIDPQKSSFIIVGDTRGKSAWEFWREKTQTPRKEIADEIARREPAFIINLGDLVLNGSSSKDWRDFDDLNRTIRKEEIPYLPVLGNHDLRGNREVALENFFVRFPGLVGRRWYSFTWRDVAFIVLDANFDDLSPQQKADQNRWYLEELKHYDLDRDVDYVIVCCHEPPFTNGEAESPSPDSKAFFADPFLRFRKTALFFSGHSHTYERFDEKGKFFIVSGGGGAPRHRVETDPAKCRPEEAFSGPSLRFFHFCQLELRGNRLSFEVVRLNKDGSFSIADSLTIGRPSQQPEGTSAAAR